MKTLELLDYVRKGQILKPLERRQLTTCNAVNKVDQWLRKGFFLKQQNPEDVGSLSQVFPLCCS